MRKRPWLIAAIIVTALYGFCFEAAWSLHRFLANPYEGSEETQTLPSAWLLLTTIEQTAFLGWGNVMPGFLWLRFSYAKIVWHWQWAWLIVLCGLTWRIAQKKRVNS